MYDTVHEMLCLYAVLAEKLPTISDVVQAIGISSLGGQ
jgi:hypothetical protein